MRSTGGFLMPALMVFVCGFVSAEPIEDLVPADVAFYVRCDFAARDLEATSLSQLWHEVEVQDCLKALSDGLESTEDSPSRHSGLTLLEWRDVVSREIACAVLGGAPGTGGETPDVVFFLRVGPAGSPSAKAVDKLTTFLVEDNETETRTVADTTVTVVGDGKWAFARRGDLLMAGTRTGLEGVLSAPENPLNQDPVFSTFRSQYAPRGDFAVARISLAGFMAMIPRDEDNERVQKLLALSGGSADAPFDALLRPDGRGLKLMALARQSGEATLFQGSQSILLDEKEILPLVPADATFFLTTGIDFRDAYESIRKMAELSEDAPEGGASEFAEAIAEFEQEAGVSIEEDLLAGLGQRIVLLARQSSSAGMPMMPAIALVVQVADQEAMERFLKPLLALIQEEGEVQLASMEFRGHTIRYLQLPQGVPFSPAYAFSHGNLIISLSPLSLKEYLAFLDSAGPDISTDEDFASTRARLGAATHGMTYARLREIGLAAYGVLPMILNFIPAGTLGGFDAANLPLPGTIQKHLFGAVSVSRTGPEGAILEAYSPIGAPVSGIAAPIAVGLLLPALGRARGEARATQCRSNLRQIGLGIVMYSSDHEGRGPEKLTDLLEEGYLTQKGGSVLMCPEHNGEGAQPGDGYVLREAFANGTMKLSSNIGEPIVWDDPSKLWHGERINVLFTDGSVKTFMTAGMPEPPSPDAREWPELVEALRELYPVD